MERGRRQAGWAAPRVETPQTAICLPPEKRRRAEGGAKGKERIIFHFSLDIFHLLLFRRCLCWQRGKSRGQRSEIRGQRSVRDSMLPPAPRAPD
jgi:hypothetical protein